MATAATAKPKVKFIRVDSPAPDQAVDCAGARWAGRSEVPASTITAAQLDQLKAHKSLKVEEIERDAEEPDAKATAS
ncbi:MAG: hypothetical protein Q8R98_28885 [Rubrivivax sp.]|nr:hypothetical protein [Rubrivivax sp.]MDP3615874.1 hypothetical protein [Rubrivivax sp.]